MTRKPRRPLPAVPVARVEAPASPKPAGMSAEEVEAIYRRLSGDTQTEAAAQIPAASSATSPPHESE